MWGTFSTLCLDECEGHFQLCGGTNMGHIFNSIVGKMWGTFSTLARQMWGTFSTLLLDKCGEHFQTCGGTNVGDIFNSGGKNVG